MPYTVQTRGSAPPIDYGWRSVDDIGDLLAENLTAVNGVERRGSVLSIPPDMYIRKKKLTRSLGEGRGEVLDCSLYVGITGGRIEFVLYELANGSQHNRTPHLEEEVRRHIKGLAAQLVAEGEMNVDLERSFLEFMGYIP
jgi:hypothetical protein